MKDVPESQNNAAPATAKPANPSRRPEIAVLGLGTLFVLASVAIHIDCGYAPRRGEMLFRYVLLPLAAGLWIAGLWLILRLLKWLFRTAGRLEGFGARAMLCLLTLVLPAVGFAAGGPRSPLWRLGRQWAFARVDMEALRDECRSLCALRPTGNSPSPETENAEDGVREEAPAEEDAAARMVRALPPEAWPPSAAPLDPQAVRLGPLGVEVVRYAGAHRRESLFAPCGDRAPPVYTRQPAPGLYLVTD
jgi:hypothetical protein